MLHRNCARTSCTFELDVAKKRQPQQSSSARQQHMELVGSPTCGWINKSGGSHNSLHVNSRQVRMGRWPARVQNMVQAKPMALPFQTHDAPAQSSPDTITKGRASGEGLQDLKGNWGSNLLAFHWTRHHDGTKTGQSQRTAIAMLLPEFWRISVTSRTRPQVLVEQKCVMP